MKIWNDIATTALMGTERSAIKPVVDDGDPLLSTLAQVGKGEADSALLATAGIIAVYRKAGVKPAVSTEALPDPADVDTVPECSPRAAHLLSIVFAGGEFRDLVPETLRLVIQAGQRVPSTLLPNLLDLGRQSTAIREDILGAIGRRGAWLAGHNPDWSYAAGGDLSLPFREGPGVGIDWSTAPRAARVGILKTIGRRDPDEARRLLASTWPQEGADDRAALLAARADSLSMEDEDFLETALDDRSAAVRAAAADLLGRLPGSAYVRRMIDRATPLIKVRYKFLAGHVLEVDLPKDLDASMKRDGLDVYTSSQPSVDEGRRSTWLRQTIAVIPPSHWSSTFDRSPAELFALVMKSEWATLMIGGLRQAIGRFPDDAWTLAILRVFVKNPAYLSNVGDIAPAVGRLPVQDFEPIVLDFVESVPVAAIGPLQNLLGLYPGEWSPRLTQAMFEKIRKSLAEYSDNQTLGAVAAILREVCMRVPPSTVEELAAVVDGTPLTASYWNRSTEQALSLLRMRKDLRETILESTPLPRPSPLQGKRSNPMETSR